MGEPSVQQLYHQWWQQEKRRAQAAEARVEELDNQVARLGIELRNESMERSDAERRAEELEAVIREYGDSDMRLRAGVKVLREGQDGVSPDEQWARDVGLH